MFKLIVMIFISEKIVLYTVSYTVSSCNKINAFDTRDVYCSIV